LYSKYKRTFFVDRLSTLSCTESKHLYIINTKL